MMASRKPPDVAAHGILFASITTSYMYLHGARHRHSHSTIAQVTIERRDASDVEHLRQEGVGGRDVSGKEGPDVLCTLQRATRPA